MQDPTLNDCCDGECSCATAVARPHALPGRQSYCRPVRSGHTHAPNFHSPISHSPIPRLLPKLCKTNTAVDNHGRTPLSTSEHMFCIIALASTTPRHFHERLPRSRPRSTAHSLPPPNVRAWMPRPATMSSARSTCCVSCCCACSPPQAGRRSLELAAPSASWLPSAMPASCWPALAKGRK